MKNDNIYLAHIRDAIECVEQYIDGIEYEQFTGDRMRV